MSDIRGLYAAARDIQQGQDRDPAGRFSVSLLAPDLASLVVSGPEYRVVAIGPASLSLIADGLPAILKSLGV